MEQTTLNFNLTSALLAVQCSHCSFFRALPDCLDPEQLFFDHREHLHCVTLSLFVWFNDNRHHSIIPVRFLASPLDATNN